MLEGDAEKSVPPLALYGVIASSEVQKSQAHIDTVIELCGTPLQKLNELCADVIGLSYEATRDRFRECGNIVGTLETKKAYRTKLQDVRLAFSRSQGSSRISRPWCLSTTTGMTFAIHGIPPSTTFTS